MKSITSSCTLRLASFSTLTALLIISSSGCATTQPPAPTPASSPVIIEHPLHFEATGSAFLEEEGAISIAHNPLHDSFIEATGCGLAAPDATTAVLKKFTALEAARYRALAGLMEKMNGIQVTRNAAVENMTFAGEQIITSLSGTLSGYSVIKETYDIETDSGEVTLQITMDKNGTIVPQRATRVAPTSLFKRKEQAETAARINATASLREQLGQIHVMQDIQVENLELSRQQARLQSDGWIEKVEFSDARWLEGNLCEITATLDITQEQLNQFINTTKEEPSNNITSE